MRRTWMVLVAVLAIGALLAGTGCRRVRLRESEETNTDARTQTSEVALEGAKSLDAKLVQGVGELRMSAIANPAANASTPATASSAAADGTITATFTYAPAAWEPELTYTVDGERGELIIRQPDKVRVPALRDATNIWVLAMPAGVPTQLDLTLGVGRSVVDLRGLDVTRLDLVNGIGDATVDVSGPRTSDLSGHIVAGVGRLTVKVPEDVGVRISGREDGVGHFSADGFVARGNGWENEAYESTAGPRIQIDLERGIGDVTLVMVR